MSGDVQPRKRKDKKKKKDEAFAGTTEELRGTAAAFGEGDVLMHSQQEHGTGGHWCAKLVFFSLLAVLVGLIGLIILENRGLSELEANAVESRYASVLEGWLEDAADDHHDLHTLELTHPNEEEHDESEDEGADSAEEDAELEDIEQEPADAVSARYAEPYLQPGLGDDALALDGADGDDTDDGDEEAEQLEPEGHYSDEENDDDGGSDDADNTDDGDADNTDDGDDDFLQNDNLSDELDQHDDGPEHNLPYEEMEESVEQVPADSLLEEEAYEQHQRELRRAEEEEAHVWLKASGALALLAAAYLLLRRAAPAPAPAPAPEDEAGEATQQVPADSSAGDRRMTLLPDAPALPEIKKWTPQAREPTPDEPESEPEPEPEPESEPEELEQPDDEEEIIVQKQATISKEAPKKSFSEEEEEMPAMDNEDQTEAEDSEVADDVELIDDEAVDDDEAVEDDVDEEQEEEISDVDDAELLSRLEAKYGRLPEPERYGVKKDGANSMIPEEEWGEEPDEERWRRELHLAQDEMNRGQYASALSRASAPELAGSARARWLAAHALDRLAEARKSNALLERAIDAYLHLIQQHRLSDEKLTLVAERVIDRARFRGTALAALPAHRALVRRFPRRASARLQLVVSCLTANQLEQAEEALQEMLSLWPEDRAALAHYGFVLKMRGRLPEAVQHLERALADGEGEANEARFHYHLGDALLQLGRREEAQAVHARAAALGHFKSAEQRSLYNVWRLTARPWWDLSRTRYAALVRALEAEWRHILSEGEAAKALYEAEKEGLRERGEWSQLDIISRGQEIGRRCARAPVTCRVVRAEPGAAQCRRGQVKFSLLAPGTHVRAHVGPTNCRLRLHLALTDATGAFLRVHNETRQWQVGRVLAFDDSFEHEVWHNGTAPRLVLIVDVWHPDLSDEERRTLTAI